MTRSVERAEERRPLLVALGTETYQDGFTDLLEVRSSLRTVVEALQHLGYATATERLDDAVNLNRGDLLRKLSNAAYEAEVVIVYYTGHGSAPPRGLYHLILHDTKPPADESAVAATQIPQSLVRYEGHRLASEQPKVLLILDCCYSETGGIEIDRQTMEGVGCENLWVLTSASREEEAKDGLFAQWFAEAVRKPPSSGHTARWVRPLAIAESIKEAHPGARQSVQCFQCAGDPTTPPFIPNPDYEAGVAGLTSAEQYWLARLRGAPDASTTGYYLTGRTGRVKAAQDLVEWLTLDPKTKGLAVVTGSAGTGKSALLSLPIRLCGPKRLSLTKGAKPDSLIMRTAEALPEATRLVAVLARGLNGDQVARAIAVALDREAETVMTLLEDLKARPDPDGTTVVVDAVDETVDTESLSESLLQPLASRLRVVVGCRNTKQALVGRRDRTIDLDAPVYRDPEALTDYVHDLLTGAQESDISTPYLDDASTAQVAEEIAKRATEVRKDGSEIQSFLTAQLMARTIRGRPERIDTADTAWKRSLPAGLGHAFDEDLKELGSRAASARPLLEALAWARGPGMPREGLWIPVAQALADRRHIEQEESRPPITDDDIRWLQKEAGAYIVEDLGPGGSSVFRLFHRELAAHLRRAPDSGPTAPEPQQREHEASAEQAVTNALVATVPHDAAGHRDWLSAHLYLRTYLAQHAAAAGPDVFARLMEEGGFLAVADRVTLTPVLTKQSMLAEAPSLAGIERIYRRARPLLTPNARANAAYLEEAATALEAAHYMKDHSVRPWYSTLMASVRPDQSRWTMTGHTETVNAVAFGRKASGRLLMASASDDESVRLWNPITNLRYKQPLRKHRGSVRTVAFGTTREGTLLLASAGWHNVRVWDATSTTQIKCIPAHAGVVNSVAFGTDSSGELLLASGGNDGKVRLWNPTEEEGTALHDLLTGHAKPVNCVAFGTIQGELMLASAGADGTVRLWNPTTGLELPDAVTTGTGAVNAVAFAAYQDRLLLAWGGEDGAVHIDDAERREPFCEPVVDHHGAVRSLDLATSPDGELILYVADSAPSGRVHMWQLPSGSPAGPPLAGHGRAACSVATVTGRDGRPLLASASEDKTVRAWDPLTARHDEPPPPPPPHVLSVALRPNGASGPQLAYGSDDGSVRLWDGNGKPHRLGEHRAGARTVAFGMDPARHNLLVSGSDDGEIKLWSPDRRKQVGEFSTGTGHAVTTAAFGPSPEDQPVLALGDDEGRVWLSRGSGGALQGLYRHQDAVRTLTFGTGPDGCMLLVSGGVDGSIRLWDCKQMQPGHSPLSDTSLPGVLVCGTISGGRCRVATGDERGFVRLLDPVTGELLYEPPRGRIRTAVGALTFSTTEDGHIVVLSAGEAWLQVWDVTARTAPVALRRLSDVQAIAINGTTLAIGDDEGVSVLAFHG
ncbi:caspase family protein [Streptomyces sp. NBC_01443]|uniref:caspase family protein n=1 Tax=Streptomyces sp. NBC_01443 TaxID=2903868 RepID=UPI0022561D62|nr:caspase family protein [Streptomyces sp. NBC_01443]MCX4632872.1 WD40 repeat domain-containing protein [Streptomyces sp. NBC_01443]